MIIRFSGTPGQLLCGIRIKDANTFKNITTMQAAIRCILIVIIAEIIFFSIGYVGLLIAIVLATIFDKHKQFFHDKIVRTVAIDYKPSS